MASNPTPSANQSRCSSLFGGFNDGDSVASSRESLPARASA